jgi:hypothetical protein
MALEAGIIGVLDIVEAQLVECVPPADPEPVRPELCPVTDSPIAQMMDATIEQTGAGPPPKA